MPGMHATMHEYKEGDLHSGSKKGPVVKSRKQAIAIGLSEERKGGVHVEANHHRHKEHHGAHHHKGHPHKDPPKHHVDHSFGHSHLRSHDNGGTHKQPHGKSTGEQKMKGHELEPAHNVFGEGHEHKNPTKALHHPPSKAHAGDSYDRPHTGPTHGFGHAAHQRHGPLRMSGVEGAHRVGKRKK